MNKVLDIIKDDIGTGAVDPTNEEPIYLDTYLPRKFKIGITVPGDNSIDIYTHDIGIVVMTTKAGQLRGFNIMVGGGLGRTHRKESTFPRLADHLGFVKPEDLYDVLKAIVAVQRDHGNRELRINARMKYLVEKWGIAKFREYVEQYAGVRVRRKFESMIGRSYYFFELQLTTSNIFPHILRSPLSLYVAYRWENTRNYQNGSTKVGWAGTTKVTAIISSVFSLRTEGLRTREISS